MLRIDCPYCGARDETEFRFGGDAAAVRPARPEPASWVRHLYWRQNPAGERDEFWLHSSGCCRWLRVRRDTHTNRILTVCDGTRPARNAP